MSWSSKVIWSEGMFLQPHHLQQHERHLERLLEGRCRSIGPYPWGFVSLELDEAAAGLGKVAVRSARGVFPDGTPFDFPSLEAGPLALDIPPSTKGERVVLAVPLARPGALEADIEGRDATGLTRYATAEVEVTDSTLASAQAALVQIGELRLSLMLAHDATDAYATMAVAKVGERRADGTLELDKAFIPPVLATRCVSTLSGFIAEIVGKLHRQGDELGQRLAHPGRGGVAEIAEFVLLQTINRFEPVFRHFGEIATLHPATLYAHCLMLAGDLSTFSREARRPRSYPTYVHDDLQSCFEPLMQDLWHSLSMAHEQNAIPIELLDRKFGLRVAKIADLELLRSASFVLAVNAQMPGDTLRARFPTQVKIGPVERIRDLVNLALPGIALRPQPVAPRQLPYHAGFTYFELERNGELWKQLQQSGGLAMHVAGDFPGLELEFWAIRG
jgi:type VI secretion system protein ImpJ